MDKTNICKTKDIILGYMGHNYFYVPSIKQQGISYNYIVVKYTKDKYIRGVYKWDTDEMKRNDIIPLLEEDQSTSWLIPCDSCKFICPLKDMSVLNETTRQKVEDLLKSNKFRRTNKEIKISEGQGKRRAPVIRCIDDNNEFCSANDAAIHYDIGLGVLYKILNKTGNVTTTDLKFEWIDKRR